MASAARTARSGSSSCVDGRAEERHYGVADELFHCAAVVLELRADAGVVRPENRLHVLRVHRLRLRRKADEVAKDNSDDLALTARVGHHAIFLSSISALSM